MKKLSVTAFVPIKSRLLRLFCTIFSISFYGIFTRITLAQSVALSMYQNNVCILILRRNLHIEIQITVISLTLHTTLVKQLMKT